MHVHTYQEGAANSFLYMPMDPILEQLAHFYSSEELASRIDALFSALADGADVLDLGSLRLGLERVTGESLAPVFPQHISTPRLSCQQPALNTLRVSSRYPCPQLAALGFI